jgi:TolB-like protein/tetratricopeptide (TPR) repeat protein
MSPDLVRGDTVDARADLFALGVVVYELATGRRPFAGTSFVDVGSAILRDDPAPVARSDAPSDLQGILDRLLAKAPRERFQSALDVANELRALRRSLDGVATSRKKPAAIATIAVLPFANRSASADDEYFSDGLADELLSVLSKIRGLRVAARTSSFHFKGKDATIADIGRALNVDTVLEGSVRKAGNRVRIAVQLVQVKDGYHLWSDTYDRTLDDVFATQEEIARAVVKELRVSLLGGEVDSEASGEVRAEVSRAAKGRDVAAEARRLFLEAQFHNQRMAESDLRRAIELLERAVELEPDFALGWAELSMTLTRIADAGYTEVGPNYERALEAVERALRLDPALAEGYAQMSWIQSGNWDWKAAEKSIRRALELAPGDATVLRYAGVLNAELGRYDDALDLLRQGLERDPVSRRIHHTMGNIFLVTGRFSEAEAVFRKSLEISPSGAFTHGLRALTLLELGQVDEAVAEVALEVAPVMRLQVEAQVQHALGRPGESDRALEALIERYAADYALQIAVVFAYRGQTELAFEWLERGFDLRDHGLSDLRLVREFRALEGDPRWHALLERVGLED